MVAAGALLYFARLALIPVFIAMLFAVTLAPALGLLLRARVPRTPAALLLVVLVFGALASVGYFGYRQAADAIAELPHHEAELRLLVRRLRRQQSTVQQTAEHVLDSPPARDVPNPPPTAASVLSAISVTGELVLAVSFVPFLTYFMLSWAPHVRRATARLLSDDGDWGESFDEIGRVLRRFIVANVVLAAAIAAVSAAIFGLVLDVPDPITVGIAAGALNVLPYLGVFIAPVVPLLADVPHLDMAHFMGILATSWGLHLMALNFVYPRLMGARMKLNPLMATIAMLVWTCLWGAIGLVLAIPLTATLKVICDRVPRLRHVGEWLGT